MELNTFTLNSILSMLFNVFSIEKRRTQLEKQRCSFKNRWDPQKLQLNLSPSIDQKFNDKKYRLIELNIHRISPAAVLNRARRRSTSNKIQDHRSLLIKISHFPVKNNSKNLNVNMRWLFVKISMKSLIKSINFYPIKNSRTENWIDSSLMKFICVKFRHRTKKITKMIVIQYHCPKRIRNVKKFPFDQRFSLFSNIFFVIRYISKQDKQ